MDHSHALDESDVSPDPVVQFSRWYDEAAAELRVPEAVALATATPNGRPSLRMVLLKSYDARGFVFYTNRSSRKGEELAANPYAALLFHFDPFGRQVRIEGAVTRVSEAESDAYFATRPRGAQLAASASHQSRPVANRAELDEAVAVLAMSFEGAEVPRPPHWGGYRVEPELFEFWQNRDDRLHDRLVYTPSGDRAQGWRIERLQP